MECGSIVALLTAFLAVVSVVLGVKYKQGLEKARLFTELLEDIISAAEDNKLTEEEFQTIVAEAKRVTADMEDES